MRACLLIPSPPPPSSRAQVKLRNIEERERQQLQLEVETLAKLSHPNIIGFIDQWTTTSGEEDKSADLTVNFITELCTSNLRTCARRGSPGVPARGGGSCRVARGGCG